MRFHPQIVFITGASSGIGRALALEYARPGRRVGLLARRRELLEEVAAACRERGAAAWIGATDVCDRAAMARAAEDFLAWAGGVHLVVANAGGGAPEEGLDAAALEAKLNLNVVGAANTFAPFLTALRAGGGGQIAGVASLAGYRGLPRAPAYSAAKAALICYLEAQRALLAPAVSVSVICPGYVRTPLTARHEGPMPWLMTPEAAARAIRRGLERGRGRIVFPWQLGLVVRALRHLPHGAYDACARRMARGASRAGR